MDIRRRNFKSILKDDCDRLYKKFEKLTTELGTLNKGITNEYLQSLPKEERDLIMEKAVKLHLQFVPLIHLQTATGKYVDHIAKTLDELYPIPKKEDNE